MRLCQPYFRALARSFAAVWLLAGVTALMWIIAAVALARLIDAQLAREPQSALLPLLTVGSIACAGALGLQHARGTLLQRRRIWLEHGLGEVVLAHELWLGSETRHRTRSLAAVKAIADFTGSRAATALTEAPWAMAIAGGLWSVQMDIAAVLSVAMVLMLALALPNCRLTRTARQFDALLMAETAGQDIIRVAGLETNASLENARRVASQWEATQRGRVSGSYGAAQAHSRRALSVIAIKLFALVGIAGIAAAPSSGGRLSAGGLVAAGLVAMAVLQSLARWVEDAEVCAAARAAQRQLATLRVARSRSGAARSAPLAPPDLRAPIAAGLFVTAATAAGLAGAVVHWHLPVMSIMRDVSVFASPLSHAAVTPEKSTNAVAATGPEHQIRRLRADLVNAQGRVAALHREANALGTAMLGHPALPPLATLEAAAAGLTTTMKTMLDRIATLERELAEPVVAKHPASPPVAAPTLTKDIS